LHLLNSAEITQQKIATTAFVQEACDEVAASDVGLGNVTNESKATMFSSPTFTGTLTSVLGADGSYAQAVVPAHRHQGVAHGREAHHLVAVSVA
jgi:hypothetical protein